MNDTINVGNSSELPFDASGGTHLETPAPPRQSAFAAWIAAILPNGFPDRSQLEPASCLAIEPARLILNVARSASLPAGRWVVGLEVRDAQRQFVAVEVVHPDTAGGTAIEATRLQGERDFFHDRQRIPHCSSQSHRFQTALSTEALERWAKLGVLEAQFHDRVLLCPKCQSVPSVRGGCRVCGSAQVASATSIHHFNCGFVGPVGEFEQADRLQCPHCQARNLVVGADYEYQSNSYTCEGCGWQDANLEFVLQCLACELRFPIHQAVEHDLIAYHVHRMDPLAAFPAT